MTVAESLLDFVVYQPSPSERAEIVSVVDRVAGEGLFLRTDRYIPTPDWELVLERGANREQGMLLIVVKDRGTIVGFARLFPDLNLGRGTGNVGIVLLPEYRGRRIGGELLDRLIREAPEYGFVSLAADIFVSNTRSLRLFHSRNFAEITWREVFTPHSNRSVEEATLLLENFGSPHHDVPNAR